MNYVRMTDDGVLISWCWSLITLTVIQQIIDPKIFDFYVRIVILKLRRTDFVVVNILIARNA